MTSESFARTRRHGGRPESAPAHYTGRRALDEHGLGLGSITDVVYDPEGSNPEYLVVDPGRLRAAHYVPVVGCYSTNDDEVVLGWDKQWIKHAPKARRDHVLTRTDRLELQAHYATR